MNTAPDPAAATMLPAMAGPTERAMLMAMLFKATADCNSSRGTSSGMIAPHAGIIRKKVKSSKINEPVTPVRVRIPSTPAQLAIQTCVPIRNRRRSTMSAMAPAGMASRKNGVLVAACTSETITGVGASEVISHPAPTSCIHEAMFTNRMAIHSMRNTPWRNGVHAPICLASCFCGVSSIAIVPSGVCGRKKFACYKITLSGRFLRGLCQETGKACFHDVRRFMPERAFGKWSRKIVRMDQEHFWTSSFPVGMAPEWRKYSASVMFSTLATLFSTSNEMGVSRLAVKTKCLKTSATVI